MLKTFVNDWKANTVLLPVSFFCVSMDRSEDSYEFDQTEEEESESGKTEEEESESDWYDPNKSDTEQEMPDPNDNPENLYQDVGQLPKPLRKMHFEEGCLYLITPSTDKEVSALGMIIENKTETFLFRAFSYKGKVRKTYHQGAKDKSYRYDEIWRLAPRRELMLSRSVKDIRRNQTISFDYDSGRVTARVISMKANSVNGIIMCGSERGTVKAFETFELLNVVELFASSLLYDVHEALDTLKWEKTKRSKTKQLPKNQPSLNPNFMCPEPILCKRLWHFEKYFGEALQLVCDRSNERMRRKLEKSTSED